MDKIKYIAYYDSIENKNENRNYVLAATNKIDYIISALNNAGYEVEIVSASGTKNKHGYKGKTIDLDKRNHLKLFRTFRYGNKINRIISILSMKVFLLLYIITHTKKNESIIVYHSLGYASLLCLARKLKRFKLILEVEEIYADVNGREKDRKKEYRIFELADAFIFPTELLNDKLNNKGRPYTIIHGTYKTEPDRKCKFNDGKIHCIYAGTFDPRKGGVTAAASAAAHLDKNYHIHILGFGSEKEKKMLQEQIDELSKTCECTVTFDGLKSGEEYIRFLQSCDIGLSTQNPDAAFNGTSFPSKILSYMANGLRVVSIRIPAIESSAIGKYIYYYDNQTPEQIAKAIRRIDFEEKYDSRKVIDELDESFIRDIKNLLGEM